MMDKDLLLLKALAKAGITDADTLKAIDEAYDNVLAKTKQLDSLKGLNFFGKALNCEGIVFPLKFERFDVTDYNDLRMTFRTDDFGERITYTIKSYRRLFALTEEELLK